MKILPSGILIFIVTCAPAIAAPQYSARFIGTLIGVSGLNASGQIVGSSDSPSVRGWVAGPFGPQELLPLPPGMVSSWAKDINDNGVIVGAVSSFSSPDFSPVAAVWTPDGDGGYAIRTFGHLPGDLGSVATAVNSVGDVVGYSKGGTFRRAVWFTEAGGLVDLTPQGIFDPNAINDERVLVDSSTPTHRMDLDTMVPENLPLPAGSYRSTTGYAINESGQVAGTAVLTSGSCVTQAARFTDGIGWEILSSCSSAVQASGINDLGDTIWRHAIANYVLLEGEGTFVVEDLIVNTVGHWSVVNSYAVDINNSRELAVFAHNDTLGQSGTVLLVPMCTSAPGEMAGLKFDADKTTLRWNAAPVTYDVAHGTLPQIRVGQMECIDSGLTSPELSVPELPPAGGMLGYLVRGVNDCGAGAWGGAITSPSCP
jgi:uncharacterized membrane protein